jgi:hypothetical protein
MAMSTFGVCTQELHYITRSVSHDVFAPGALDGNATALNSDGFARQMKEARTPLKLILPVPTRTVR